MSKRIWLISICLFLLAGMLAAAPRLCAADDDEMTGKRGAILVVYYYNYPPNIDKKFESKMRQLGFAMDTLRVTDLSAEKLKPYNVVICQWQAYPNSDYVKQAWTNAAKILLDYVKKGGGLIYLNDESYLFELNVSDIIFKDLGLTITNEYVTDPDNYFQQTDFLLYFFATTKNITPHPITKGGIDSVIYPLGHALKGATTRALKVSSDWTVLIRGESSASAATMEGKSSFSSAPPIAAVREYGKGRILVLGFSTTFTVHAGYHKIWEELVLEKGNFLPFFVNAFDWLAAPSLESGVFGGYTEKKNDGEDIHYEYLDPNTVAGPETPFEKKPWTLKNVPGLFGARSTVSGGRSTVKELCDAAKENGCGFLAFTEPVTEMNEEKYNQLIDECKAQSTDTFSAIPGLILKDSRNNNIIGIGMTSWPGKAILGPDESRLESSPGLLFSYDRGFPAVVTTGGNPAPPYFISFYKGVALFSYEGSKLTDDATYLYQYLTGNNYMSVPIVYNEISNADQIASLDGYKTYVWSTSGANAQNALSSKNGGFVSNGPMINEFAGYRTWWPGTFRDHKWLIHFDVTSDVALKKVTVMDGTDIYRTYYPKGKHFAKDFLDYHDKQRYFSLVAEDVEGRKAYSFSIYTQDIRHSIYMCTDLQNTIDCSFYKRMPDGEITYAATMGLAGASALPGRPGIMVPEFEIFPQGLDYVTGGFSYEGSQQIYTTEGTEYGGIAYRHKFGFASGDVTMLDHYTDMKFIDTYKEGRLVDFEKKDMEIATSRIRVKSWTPKMYSYNIIEVERDTEFLEDVTMVEGSNRHLPYEVVFTMGPFDSLQNYAYINGSGEKITGKRTHKDWTVYIDNETVAKGGYASLYPDFYGAPAVYPLDDDYRLRYSGSSFSIGLFKPGDEVKAGTKLRHHYLVVRDKFGSRDTAGFDRIRDIYGLDGTSAYDVNVSKGTLDNTVFTLSLEASDYGTVFDITSADFPNELPVEVAHLNENWHAGCVNLDTGWMRRIGVGGTSAHFTLDTSNPQKLFAGNLVMGDDPDVRLYLFSENDGYYIVACNPLDKDVTVNIRTPDELKSLYAYSGTVDLKPGEEKIIQLD